MSLFDNVIAPPTAKSIKEWGLDPTTEKIVRKELEKWLSMFKDYAEGAEGNVYRADFTNPEAFRRLFFFTDCRDILSKNPESRGDELGKTIRLRKRYVLMQLLIKNILDGPIKKEMKCTHCGDNNVWIDSLSNLGGHYKFCPKCGKTDLCIYPFSYEKAVETLRSDLKKRGFKYEHMQYGS